MLYFSREAAGVPPSVFEFAGYRVDCGRFELLRDGRSLRLERKPLELLILLATSEGRLVTRAQIAQHLWSSEVFVDTEHGINTAIRKIRSVLRDDAESPQFIQTVPAMGYRFIAPLQCISPPPSNGTNLSLAPTLENPSPPEPAPPLPVSPADIENTKSGSTEQLAPAPPPQKTSGHPSRRLVAIGSLIALVLIAIVGSWIRLDWTEPFFHPGARLQISSLAVIPLENLSGDPGQDYFADGMTDELITMLAKNSTLRIISRTSVMQYKGVHRPVRDIARELGVDGILEGSVARSGNVVHLTLQLIHAPTDTHLWAESYDRETSDSVSLPIEAARTIATRLGQVKSPQKAQRYVSPQAHDGYIRGLYYEHSGNYAKAIETFNEVVASQPDYALAWNELANSYGWSSTQSRPSESAQDEGGPSQSLGTG